MRPVWFLDAVESVGQTNPNIVSKTFKNWQKTGPNTTKPSQLHLNIVS
jgi:hypothetical protein